MNFAFEGREVLRTKKLLLNRLLREVIFFSVALLYLLLILLVIKTSISVYQNKR